MTKMPVLITRPRTRSQALIRVLQEEGYDPVCSPMQDIALRAESVPGLASLGKDDALIVTSISAVDWLGTQPNVFRSVKVFAVGESTATAARYAGFVNVQSAGGTAQDLLDLVKTVQQPQKGRIWYLSGQNIRLDLSRCLQEQGYVAKRRIVYETRLHRAFTPEASQLIEGSLTYAVLFFAPSAARQFQHLALKTSKGDFQHVKAICLSGSVADELRELNGLEIHISEAPNAKSLYSRLTAVFPQRDRKDGFS